MRMFLKMGQVRNNGLNKHIKKKWDDLGTLPFYETTSSLSIYIYIYLGIFEYVILSHFHIHGLFGEFMGMAGP